MSFVNNFLRPRPRRASAAGKANKADAAKKDVQVSATRAASERGPADEDKLEARPMAREVIPKLALPAGAKSRTSNVGKTFELDKVVTHRREMRQLRRLYDEHELGDDVLRVADWVTGRLLSEHKEPLHKMLARAGDKGLLESHIERGAAALPRDEVLDLLQGESPGEQHLMGHAHVLRAYWGNLATDLDNFESAAELMLAQGTPPADIVAAPETKRFVRVLGNELALLRKDITQLQSITARYATGIMALRERVMSAAALDDIKLALMVGALATSAEADEVMQLALSPHVHIDAPSNPEAAARVASLRQELAGHMPALPDRALRPSPGTPQGALRGAQAADEALFDRLARAALGMPAKLKIQLEHPLLDGRQIVVKSPREVAPLREHFLAMNEVVLPLLTELLQPTALALQESLAELKDAKLLAAKYAADKPSSGEASPGTVRARGPVDEVPKGAPIRIISRPKAPRPK